MLAYVLTISLLALNVKAGIVAAPDNHGETSPELQIITATKERIEAEYSTLTGGGILIVSEVSPRGEAVHVSVKSTNGETIFEVDRPLGDVESHLLVAGEEFLLINDTSSDGSFKVTIYHTPAVYSQHAKAMKYLGYAPKPMLRQLDGQTAHISGQNAVAKLMAHPKLRLINEAAFALGHHIHGTDNPAAMAYYATALRLSRISEESARIMEDISFEQTRYRRWGLGWLIDTLNPSKEHCSNSDSECPKGECPEGEKCRGLCGPKCTCWYFICGDCCWNLGCYEHDRICTPNGKHSVECLATAPIGFVCS